MGPDEAHTPADAALFCPLCGAPNDCALERERRSGLAQPPCWCGRVEFDAALLARVAPRDRRLRCICMNCATLEGSSRAQR